MRGSAELALAALRELAPDGHPTPQAVVDAARPEGSPLHMHFQWDDTLAATQHRLAQARRLVSSIVVTYLAGTGDGVQVPAYLSVRQHDGSRSYSPAFTVAQDPAGRARLVFQLRREAAALAKRAEAFAELADLVRALRQA
jgi:hypothetical protein